MFKLELTNEELQLIGVALGKMPYLQVVDIMNNIQKQVSEAAKKSSEENPA